MTVEQFIQQNLEWFRNSNHERQYQKIISGILAGPFFGLREIFVSSTKKRKDFLIFFLVIFLMIWIFANGINRIFAIAVPGFWPKITSRNWPIIFVEMYIVYVLVAASFFISLKFNKDERTKRKILKEYKNNHSALNLSMSEYAKAAEILRNFKPITYAEAVANYGKLMVDILIITGGLYFFREPNRFFGKKQLLRRLVSIKAIEGDRSADEGDDD